jgi:glutathione S-transferase
MSLTFYFAPFSTATTVHWTLEELGIPYEAVRVDLKSEADKQAKLGPVNPNLRVPTLVHDGEAIFESAAIQIYLGETFGVERGLFPAPGKKRGEALKWLVWTNVTLGDAMSRFMRNTQPEIPAELRSLAAGKAARKDIDHLLGILDAALGARPYLLGKDASIVDFHLAAMLGWMSGCGISLAPFANLPAWLERCTSRPAFKKLTGGTSATSAASPQAQAG